jgi:DNA (cytosine-5)-methyltransferase 1
MNYYNEIDPYAAQWLRNLIDAGHIAPGIVDERSITDVKPTDLAGYTQCHFFAGIGVWSHALRQSGWPDSRPVWTGSCPCQPFSTAGNQKGTDDERHLWPVWFNLIRECRPPVVFGEQVEAAIRHGWLDLVQADLEREDYACGAVGIPAAGVGAPHIRQRLYFVADTDSGESGRRPSKTSRTRQKIWVRPSANTHNGSEFGELADDIDAGSQGRVRGGGV